MFKKTQYVDDFVLSGGVLLLNQTEPPADFGPIPDLNPSISLFAGTGYWAQKARMPSKRSDHQVWATVDIHGYRPTALSVIVNCKKFQKI